MLKGIYTLLIKLDKPQAITIGKLGSVSFPAGYYAYVGSALNGLESRIVRHLKKEKSFHWHIDYFLQKARVVRGRGRSCRDCLTITADIQIRMVY